MADSSEPSTAPEIVTSPEQLANGDSKVDEQTTSSPPTLKGMTASSTPLGAINAARRPGPGPPRASTINNDMQAKMRALMLSRQGPANRAATPPAQAGTPGIASNGATAGGLPGMKLPGAPVTAPRAGGMAGKGPMGGMKRKGPALKLEDAVKKDEGAPAEKTDTGSQFSKYKDIVDAQKGTLNFKDKAVVHGSGIDFSTGATFSISLDEVDTIEELGKGNYGTVFKVRHARPKGRKPGQGLRGNMSRGFNHAHNTALEEQKSTQNTTGLVMAMKEIRLELDDAKFAQIIMELDILHRCVSPFIIDFYGAFFQEGSVYICLENMDGGSIDKLYGDGVPEGVLRKITASSVMGLKYLKDEHNIIHRDVKPTNILVNTKGQVKICDFGVSGNLVASMARTNIGCQSYMAPERISGGGMAAGPGAGGSYSVQSDIWSLGLTIIESALGRYPYPPETYNNIFSQLNAIVEGETPSLPKDRYSEQARDFVHGCLNKVPRQRPNYAALLRHPWLLPLTKPPTISEDAEAEELAEKGGEAGADIEPLPLTADKEVATWVMDALEKKRLGKMATAEKPAGHAAPLDAVPAGTFTEPVEHRKGVKIESPVLTSAKVESMDFA